MEILIGQWMKPSIAIQSVRTNLKTGNVMPVGHESRPAKTSETYFSHSTATEGSLPKDPRPPPERYQPGQLLPTIMTGETLDLEEYTAGERTSSQDYDPFSDSNTPLHPYQQISLAQQSPTRGLPQPPSNTSHEHLVAAPFSSSTPTIYSHYDKGSSPGFDTSIDHFQHDTEAYASGNFTRSSYRPPRSRSPTPCLDEDYKLDANNITHYTGYSQPGEYNPYEDEKTAYKDEYDISQYADAPGSEEYYDEAEKASDASIGYSELDTPVETRHFGPAPVGRVRRRLKKKRVQLTNGNLVVDLNVPPKLVLPYRGEPEMVKTRYTAVTCDPDDFEKEKFFLRQNENGRTTELFIVITMYNVSLRMV
jgi:chitin synthase